MILNSNGYVIRRLPARGTIRASANVRFPLYLAAQVAFVGESFGEIFAGNCVSIGTPCVTSNGSTIRALRDQCEAEPLTEIMSMTAASAGRPFSVDLAEGRRQQFLQGTWDPTAVLLEA